MKEERRNRIDGIWKTWKKRKESGKMKEETGKAEEERRDRKLLLPFTVTNNITSTIYVVSNGGRTRRRLWAQEINTTHLQAKKRVTRFGRQTPSPSGKGWKSWYYSVADAASDCASSDACKILRLHSKNEWRTWLHIEKVFLWTSTVNSWSLPLCFWAFPARDFLLARK